MHTEEELQRISSNPEQLARSVKMIGHMANWSLAVNAKQFPAVLTGVEEIMANKGVRFHIE
jgi:hypothetical protein